MTRFWRFFALAQLEKVAPHLLQHWLAKGGFGKFSAINSETLKP